MEQHKCAPHLTMSYAGTSLVPITDVRKIPAVGRQRVMCKWGDSSISVPRVNPDILISPFKKASLRIAGAIILPSSKLPTAVIMSVAGDKNDANRLAELGYRQELRRDWSVVHSFGYVLT